MFDFFECSYNDAVRTALFQKLDFAQNLSCFSTKIRVKISEILEFSQDITILLQKKE